MTGMYRKAKKETEERKAWKMRRRAEREIDKKSKKENQRTEKTG